MSFTIYNILAPGDIGIPSKTSTPSNTSDDVKKPENDSNIWHPSEVNTIKNCQTEDPRKVPEYEIKFKQAVGTEDIFLGVRMYGKQILLVQFMTNPS
jgi:hypothetical protein